MDRKSTQRLRFDRRLIGRRGWTKTEEIQSELDALPDVSHKIAPPDEDGSDDAAAADSTPVAEA